MNGIILQEARAMPEELLPVLSDVARCDLERWIGITPYIFQMSRECYYVSYKGTPLLVVGAAQLSLLNPARELWLYGSRNLHFAFLPTFREMFHDWRAGQKGSLYARTNNEKSAKFMRYFGLSHVSTDPDGTELYEV